MGHIYALAGPSGVGKTTFLNTLFESPPHGMRWLARATTRSPRLEEEGGCEYNFYSKVEFRQRLYSNEFVHVELYGDDFYGIGTRVIEEAIDSDDDAFIIAGIYGATSLSACYADQVSTIYMFCGDRSSLRRPDCLNESAVDIVELRRRLGLKFQPSTHKSNVIGGKQVRRRMDLNLLDIAYVNARMQRNEAIYVLHNATDRLDHTVTEFHSIRRRRASTFPQKQALECFVLMPFQDELNPVYDDHIVPVVQKLGLTCTRADKVCSTQAVVQDVFDAIKRASVVISDLTQSNPNVFYETGLCHALNKDVILITRDSEVPFDLQHLRHIRYVFDPRGMKDFENTLQKTVQGILASSKYSVVMEAENRRQTTDGPKTLRNKVEKDEARGCVTKFYISGTYEERVRRMSQERAALEMVPLLRSPFRTPRVLGVSDDPDPTLITEYLGHAGSVASKLAVESAKTCRSLVSEVLRGICQLHDATANGSGEASDLIGRVRRYGKRYAAIVGHETVQTLVTAATSLRGVRLASLTHQDFKPSNILLGLGGEYIVIDWEHSGPGACIYDIGTMFTSLVITLGVDGRMGQMRGLVDEFVISPSDRPAFYASVAVRALVEMGPATARMEFGDPDKAVEILRQITLLASGEIVGNRDLRSFVEELCSKC